MRVPVIAAQQPQQPVAPLQRRGPPTGRFLKLNEGLRLAVSELAGENTELQLCFQDTATQTNVVLGGFGFEFHVPPLRPLE